MAVNLWLTLFIYIVKFRSRLIDQHLGNSPPSTETAENIESRIQIPLLVCYFLVSWIETSSTALEILMICRLVGTQIGILFLLLKHIWSLPATNDFTDIHKKILESKDLRKISKLGKFKSRMQ